MAAEKAGGQIQLPVSTGVQPGVSAEQRLANAIRTFVPQGSIAIGLSGIQGNGCDQGTVADYEALGCPMRDANVF